MMQDHENHSLDAAIHRKLAEIVAASEPPVWCAAWQRLGPEASEEERLAVYRAIREAGSVPDDAGFFLVSWQIDAVTLQSVDVELHAHEERLNTLRRQHGLDAE